ncbi:ABC transporter permease [Phenylobacterium sp.]|jgi:putative spermidine/putrescine transport system permease protein|uniref:ABC transporter permease n=1 Tax=Phenylobacterium sp. TaxID=1871053 RepID=UPI003782DAF7
MQLGRWLYLGLAPMGVVLAIFMWGLLQLVLGSFHGADGFGLANYAEFFSRADYVAVLLRTLWVSAAVTAISLLIGYPVAHFIARYEGARTFILLLVILPWMVSVVVRTYGWIVILGSTGLMNQWLMWLGVLDAPAKLMFNTTGVIIGMVHVFCPFMIIAVLTSLMQVGRNLEEAAMILGARPAQVFGRVAFPLSISGVISGSTIVYLMCNGAIITPLLLGGLRERMLGTQIYQDLFQLFDIPKASAMAMILTLAAVVVVAPLHLLERRLTRHTRSSQES